MEVTFEVKLWDFVIGGWYQTLRNRAARKILLFPFLFTVLPLVFWLINAAITGHYPQGMFWRSLYELLQFTLFSTVFLGIIMFVFQTIAYMMMMPKEKRNGVACLHTIILDEDDLIEITDVNTTFIDWNGVKSIASLPNCVLMQNKGNQFHIIPKRYFESKNQITEFVELANFYRQRASKFPDNAESLIYHRREEVKKLLNYRKELDNSSRVQRLVDEA
jgi:YcxB-like protein